MSMTAIFEAYGDDAKTGLEAWANIDPQAWSAYADSAAEKQYLNDYNRWAGKRTIAAPIEVATRKPELPGQVQMFDPGPGLKRVPVKESVTLKGTRYEILDLAGAEGAAVVREVAARDLAPSVTTVKRCKWMLNIAAHVEAETVRLGRDVSIAEVLGRVA